MNYQDSWSFLDQLQFFKIKLGLDSMTRFMESLGNPQHTFPCIHIGGTNGKGSVGATLLSILKQAGYTVGFYTSPHLSSVRERFRIGDEFISEEDFARHAAAIVSILGGRQITYFEFTTALAMLWFAARQVDLALLEVGMGGRLDATNIVHPLVSVITNVGMDHEQYLGTTLGQIAMEKAGIIKPGVPVVAGRLPREALDVIKTAARQNHSLQYFLDHDFAGAGSPAAKDRWTYSGLAGTGRAAPVYHEELPLNVKGVYQVDNAALALATLETIRERFPVREHDLRRGLQGVRWPGRLEEFRLEGAKPLHFLLDGAHNPDGAKSLRASLSNDFSYKRLILVWASMSDKDVKNTLMEIAPLAGKIIFTRPEAERSANPEHLTALLPESLQTLAYGTDSVQEALDLAMDMALPEDMICIAGSLYLVGKARQLLLGELVDEPKQ